MNLIDCTTQIQDAQYLLDKFENDTAGEFSQLINIRNQKYLQRKLHLGHSFYQNWPFYGLALDIDPWAQPYLVLNNEN